MEPQSKRMMIDKQDQYREYVVNKLLDNTHIEYGKEDGLLDVRNITVHLPYLKYPTELVHQPSMPKDAFPRSKPFRKYPMEFRDEMKQYSIYDDEVQLMWDTYNGMLGKMIDVDHCREVCGSVDVAKIWREGNVETEMY